MICLMALNSTEDITFSSLGFFARIDQPLFRKASTQGPYPSFESIQATMDYKHARHFDRSEIVDRNFGEIISEWCFSTEVLSSAAPFSRNSVPNLVPTKGRHENPREPKRIWRPHSTISLIFEFRAIQPMFTIYSLQNINFFNCMLSIYVQESGIA